MSSRQSREEPSSPRWRAECFSRSCLNFCFAPPTVETARAAGLRRERTRLEHGESTTGVARPHLIPLAVREEHVTANAPTRNSSRRSAPPSSVQRLV